jgi:hypothetical protein
MNRYLRLFVLGVTLVVLTSPCVLAQKWEVHPYGGGFWPSDSSIGKIKSEGIYGVKTGYFFDPNFELEGNVGYTPHFHIKGIDPASRGWLWEMAGSWNFSAQEFPFSRKFTPFLTAGVGGLTTYMNSPTTFDFTRVEPITLVGGAQVDTLRTIHMENGDTFFNFSYGGGFKSIRLAGPIGVRADIRGRTIPNYYGGSRPTWLEVTGGINFMWGER